MASKKAVIARMNELEPLKRKHLVPLVMRVRTDLSKSHIERMNRDDLIVEMLKAEFTLTDIERALA